MNYGGNNSSVECILRPINLKYSMHLNVCKDNCIKRKGKIYLFCRHHLGGPIYLKHFPSCSYVHSHLSYLLLNCIFCQWCPNHKKHFMICELDTSHWKYLPLHRHPRPCPQSVTGQAGVQRSPICFGRVWHWSTPRIVHVELSVAWRKKGCHS